MPVLSDPRHERFAELVASGRTPADAYVAAGYKERTAYTCGPRLLKRPEVRDRVHELRQTAAQVSVTRSALNREFVLGELMDNALKAKQDQQWASSNRALELLGKELGMFVDRAAHSFSWDGDLSKLTDEQLDKLIEQFEAMLAAQNDAAAIEIGPVVDTKPAESKLLG